MDKKTKQLVARIEKIEKLTEEIQRYCGLIADAVLEEDEAALAATKPPLVVTKKAAKKK